MAVEKTLARDGVSCSFLDEIGKIGLELWLPLVSLLCMRIHFRAFGLIQLCTISQTFHESSQSNCSRLSIFSYLYGAGLRDCQHIVGLDLRWIVQKI